MARIAAAAALFCSLSAGKFGGREISRGKSGVTIKQQKKKYKCLKIPRDCEMKQPYML